MSFMLYSYGGTTGKISGRILDAESGEPLVGANVLIEWVWNDGKKSEIFHKQGASTDLEGYFAILNISPGTYSVKTIMIGYTAVTMDQVHTEIDRTTTVNFELKPKAIEGEEVVIVANRELIKKDVAASQKSLGDDKIKNLPVASVNDVIGLQAGINSNLEIRGSGKDQTMFMVDGITLRDERTNSPISAVPLSAIQEISVQTGGFNAEYSNVRSGIINVVTKEGNPKAYSGTVTYRNSQASPKHFGISPYDVNSFWMKPYLDDAVCWTGTTNGAWDTYTRRQYPSFDGWDKISQQTMLDDDPRNDLSPYAAQRLFKWQKRKQGDIIRPDYTVDAGFGGPVPLISNKLGNLRFFTSFRREQRMYLYEMSTDGLENSSWMMKMTSDISPSMKLTMIGLYGEMHATATYDGYTGYYESTEEAASSINQIGHTSTWRLFTTDYWSTTSYFNNTISAKLTHVLNPGAFYEIQLKRDYRKYQTGPGAERDSNLSYEIFPDYYVNEAPFGFEENPIFGIDGMGMGGSFSQKRDNSKFTTLSLKGDFTSQIAKYHQIKSGFEMVMNRFELSFGAINMALPAGNYWNETQRNPYRFNLYFQDKLEFEGLIATVGVVFDYVNPTGEWYDVDVYNRDFFSTKYTTDLDSMFTKKNAKATFFASPRIALSHPITTNSKLYFNYGYNRQTPSSEDMYMVRRGVGNIVQYFGDPSLNLAKTISYELGYDHALFNNYLAHIAAYYKDVTDQERWVRYVSIKGDINYWKLTNNSYEDIRGFEIDLSKNVGRWFTGNVNYEYRVSTNGYFETLYNYQNPADMRDYLRDNVYQERPKPRPRIKTNLDMHTPENVGPSVFGQRILGGWYSTLIYYWTAGLQSTWNPKSITGVEYNVQWNNVQNFDLKVSKVFAIKNAQIKFFMDIYNIFNNKNFSQYCFYDVYDYNDYMYSLHLKQSMLNELKYNQVEGDDQPGDIRKTGVEYQPLEWTANLGSIATPSARAIYFDASSKKYMRYVENVWTEVNQSQIDQIMKDKAYIDMPNLTYFTFLNPRDIFFGIMVSFELK